MSKIKVRNKIGFHAGPSGNHNGIGEYYRKLDEAGVPFVLKSVDHYGHLFEAAQYDNAPHVLCYRMSAFGQPGDYNFDVPDYSLDPDEAAAKHWKHMEERLPPEYNREKVWLEPINEIDKGRSDWLGHFAAEFGEIALREGLRVMQFAWSAGEPEPDHWETEGMLRYLRMCAENHDRLGVALHEYSYDKEDIWRLDGDLVGRFTNLFEVCDKYGIKRPNVIMSEWGWTHRRVPPHRTAIKHIESVNELYAKYPEILGGAIWYLGGGPEWGNIGDGTQKLIKPVTDFSLRWEIEVEPDSPRTAAIPTETPIRPPVTMVRETAAPTTRARSAQPEATADATASTPPKAGNAAFMADVTIPDDTEITAGSGFTKTWRVKNSGQTTWGSGYQLQFIGGNAMGETTAVDVPVAQPGQVVQVSIPMQAPAQKQGVVYGDWRMTDPNGHQFGDVLYVRIAVVPPPPSDGIDGAAFVADVTIPDDTQVDGGESFTKTWRIRNSGSKAWTAGYRLAYVGGTQMASQTAVPLPAAQPGQTVEVSVQMTAPPVPGSHWADWRPRNQMGDSFGDIVYTRIVVPQPVGDGRIRPISQNDPRWKDGRLGDHLSDTTIGDWGCLLTCFTMVANAFGKTLTPPDVNERMVRKKLFLDHKITPWNTLSKLYQDIIYEGRIETRLNPNITARIDAALKNGYPVPVQVDYTPESPYTPNDQHWVLVVGREGQDYRINEPWTYPAQEISMRTRYGRPGQLLRHSIISAVFYRTADAQPPLPVVGGGVLSGDGQPAETETPVIQTGMNVNPDAPHSNPYESEEFKGLDWARYVFKISANPDPAKRTLEAAFDQYNEIVREYQKIGVRSLIVLNQETVWGNAPWSGNGNWAEYAQKLADVSAKIAAEYARYGDAVAYEIWNEGDLPNNPASVYVPPEHFAVVLQKVAAAVRKQSPQSPIIFGGMASGPNHTIPYVQKVRQALNGDPLPVDALGIHPYGRWGTKAPFDWGQTFGTLGQAFDEYAQAFPDMPLWITEMGVAADGAIGPEYYKQIGDYMMDVYQHVNERHTKQVPVLIWFAWSDLMRNAGVVQVTGNRKQHVYDAFVKVRSKEL